MIEVKHKDTGEVLHRVDSDILAGASLEGASIAHADLRGAYLRWAKLGNADLHGADLREADLQLANLRGADLQEADLTEARLDEADLTGARLDGARLDGVCYDGVTRWPVAFDPESCGAAMVVNGLRIPTSLAQLCRAIKEGGRSRFVLKQPVDAYGNCFYGDLSEVLEGPTYFESLKDSGLTPEERQAIDEEWANDPGFPGYIPGEPDVSKLIWFGENSTGDPYCLDFRDNCERPRVIHWDDAYWRLVAPDFETFISLYTPERFHYRQDQEEQRLREEASIARVQEVLSRIEAGRRSRDAP